MDLLEAREEYVRNSAGKPFFAAVCEGAPVGFLYLRETGKATVELAVMENAWNKVEDFFNDLFFSEMDYDN